MIKAWLKKTNNDDDTTYVSIKLNEPNHHIQGWNYSADELSCFTDSELRERDEQMRREGFDSARESTAMSKHRYNYYDVNDYLKYLEGEK